MEQSFIIVTDVSEEILTNGLMDFANDYYDQKFVNEIKLYTEKAGEKFLILFTNIPSFYHFCFTVNYIHYLKTDDNKLPTVYGYYLNNLNSKEHSFLSDGFVKTYVSVNDKEYDNVNVVNDKNETYLFDFNGRQTKLSIIEQVYEVPVLTIDDYHHRTNISPSPIENKPWWKIW